MKEELLQLALVSGGGGVIIAVTVNISELYSFQETVSSPSRRRQQSQEEEEEEVTRKGMRTVVPRRTTCYQRATWIPSPSTGSPSRC